MKRIPAFAAIVLALSNCAVAPARPPEPASQAVLNSAERPPLFPFWTARDMRATPSTVEEAPPPTASAVLIAPNYLLAPIHGMGPVTASFHEDPSVTIFDGRAWRAGRYVDFNAEIGLALIRADMPEPGIRLRSEFSGQPKIVGLDAGRMRAQLPLRLVRSKICRLPREYERRAWHSSVPSGLCTSDMSTVLRGALVLDENGSLLGIIGGEAGVSMKAAADVSDIRAFLESYFSSWGKGVEPKPSL